MSLLNYPLTGPEQLRTSSLSDLEAITQDIRQQIISTCLKNGGHLGASLGAVELAVALHAVFHSPQEPIIWDVGHQAYAHKLICGRWKAFDSLRKLNGISGFLQRDENIHDVFGAGHSSTALSAALGVAWKKGRDQRENNKPFEWTIAVVGDGGLTAGLAFEALNNFRNKELGPVLIVLNDNQMSISENVGSVPDLLSGENCRTYFELFGFEYRGPVDGHNLQFLIHSLKGIRETPSDKPVLLHVRTQKGKGYTPAEQFPASYHGVNPIQPQGSVSALPKKTYSQTLGEELCRLAEKDDRIVAITAAMPEGTGLLEFAKKFPDRFFDVGIAEAHAVTFAAGLATQGMKPVVAIYSTFLQRAYDSIIHDVALQNLGVVFVIDRAGIVGQDGPTHHGLFDLGYLSIVPNLVVTAPSCLSDLASILKDALQSDCPWAIRYPRGAGPETLPAQPQGYFRIHQAVKNPELIVVVVGSAASRAIAAVSDVDPDSKKVTLVSVQCVKPIPQVLIDLLSQFPSTPVLSIEDGMLRGGFGAALLSQLAVKNLEFESIGYQDHFVTHGSLSELEEIEGLSQTALARKMKDILQKRFQNK